MKTNISDITVMEREIQKLQEAVAAKEASLKAATEGFNARVLALHTAVGLGTPEELLSALRTALRKPNTKRVRVTPEQKNTIETALRAGTDTTKDIATANKVSTATVNNLKKKLGLTQTRAAA